MDACNRYLEHAPRDFITFEYCMLDGVNDLPEHAMQLVDLVKQHAHTGVWCKFNLIPFNPFPASGLHRSAAARVTAFAGILMDAGIVTTVRKTRGDDIDAACGQLAGEVKIEPVWWNVWPSAVRSIFSWLMREPRHTRRHDMAETVARWHQTLIKAAFTIVVSLTGLAG